MKKPKTYIIRPAYKKDAQGQPIDLIAEHRNSDERWAVGERHLNGAVAYQNHTFATLDELCVNLFISPDRLRRQTKRIERERAAKAATAQHTPGDWLVEINNPLAAIPGHTIKAAHGSFLPVAIVHAHTGAKGPGEGIANARLIAAAPKMLEALKAALATLKSAGIQKDVRQQCEAIIARAEGLAS